MAWFDDLNLPGATISGFFGYVTEDGPDDDDRPDVRLASGTVTFTATTPAARVDGAWLGIRPVTATIFDGEIVVAEEDLRPVRLLATDANIGVADWAWKANFDVKGFRLSELTFKAPRDTTANLTADLIPIKSQPYQIIEGASIVDTEVDPAGERMRFKMSDGTYTSWVSVPNGEPGAKGDPGVKGDPGADGKSPTISMGSVSAGSNADAWLTGDPLARELNLTLPRGPRGDSGASTIEQVDGLAARLASIEYDSGIRDIAGLSPVIESGSLFIQRTGSTTWLIAAALKLSSEVSGSRTDLIPAGALPPGFRPQTTLWHEASTTVGTRRRIGVSHAGWVPIYSSPVAGEIFYFTIPFPTPGALPTILPGTPA